MFLDSELYLDGKWYWFSMCWKLPRKRKWELDSVCWISKPTYRWAVWTRIKGIQWELPSTSIHPSRGRRAPYPRVERHKLASSGSSPPCHRLTLPSRNISNDLYRKLCFLVLNFPISGFPCILDWADFKTVFVKHLWKKMHFFPLQYSAKGKLGLLFL